MFVNQLSFLCLVVMIAFWKQIYSFLQEFPKIFNNEYGRISTTERTSSRMIRCMKDCKEKVRLLLGVTKIGIRLV